MIALLGYAKDCLAHGGGSAAVDAHRYTSAWDALHTAFGDDVELVYGKGQSRPALFYPISHLAEQPML